MTETRDQMPTERVIKIIGVYDADGSIRGELSYWIGARLGKRYCSLCDITHGLVRERDDWRECRDSLSVPIETVHRDQIPAEIISTVGSPLPVIMAVTTLRSFVLVSSGELKGCDGSPDKLISLIWANVEREQLVV